MEIVLYSYQHCDCVCVCVWEILNVSESYFCNLVTSFMRTKDVHMVTVATEGGCFSNIWIGVCPVILWEAIHLHFTWLMVPERTNRKINYKFSSVGRGKRPKLPKCIILWYSEDCGRDSFLLGNSFNFFSRWDNIICPKDWSFFPS